MNGKKKTMGKIPENEEILKNLILNIPGAIYRCSHDRNRTMHFLSCGIEEISGYPPGDFIENRLRIYESIIDPKDRENVWEVISKAVEKRNPYSLEYRIVRKKGDIRWVSEKGTGIYDTDGSILFLDGTVFEISDKKAVEEKFWESEENYIGFIEQSSEGIMLTDEEGTVIEWNNSIAEMSGISDSQALGKPLWEVQYLLLAEERRTKEAYARIKSGILEALKTGNSDFMKKILQAKYMRSDGSIRIVQQIGFPIKTDK